MNKDEDEKKLLIINDDSEVFRESKCNCEFCYQTHRLGVEFDHYEPTTRLQKRMKRVISTLESKYK